MQLRVFHRLRTFQYRKVSLKKSTSIPGTSYERFQVQDLARRCGCVVACGEEVTRCPSSERVLPSHKSSTSTHALGSFNPPQSLIKTSSIPHQSLIKPTKSLPRGPLITTCASSHLIGPACPLNPATSLTSLNSCTRSLAQERRATPERCLLKSEPPPSQPLNRSPTGNRSPLGTRAPSTLSRCI